MFRDGLFHMRIQREGELHPLVLCGLISSSEYFRQGLFEYAEIRLRVVIACKKVSSTSSTYGSKPSSSQPLLAQLRQTLRGMMQRSPLMDGLHYMKEIEAIYANLLEF